ncbi:F-box domain-containing protein [Mycena kentingensis (nom. inval.)]|nr:F-box domain-containing protein [Mycena kentingensis (nom. inval.)]
MDLNDEQAIDADIANHKAQIQTLKTARNALQKVNQLPVEILSRIMFYVLQTRYSLVWICEISHPCRHWREVALSCPTLWNTPPFWSRNPVVVQEFLSRSKSALLAIQGPAHPMPAPIWNILLASLRQTSRLGQISASALHDTLLKEIFAISDPAPLLHTLALQMNMRSYPSPDSLPMSIPGTFLSGEVPRLQTLELDTISIAPDSPFAAPTIANLTLKRLAMSASDLLAVLAQMPLLKKLSLEDVLASPADGVAFIAPSAPRAHLSSLEALTVQSTRLGAGPTAAFVERLCYPATTRTTIATYDADLLTAASFAALTAKVIPTEDTRRRLRALSVRAGYDNLEITAWTRVPPHFAHIADAGLHLILRSRPYLGIDTFGEILEILCKTHALSALTNATISCASTCTVTTKAWVRAFGDLKHLSTLRLHGFDGTTSFFNAIAEDVVIDGVKQVPAAPAVRIDPTGGRRRSLRRPAPEILSGGLFFPALRHLTFDGTNFDEASLEMFQTVLMARCERRQELWTLKLTNCTHLSCGDVDDLGTIVVDVEWDGVEEFTDSEDDLDMELDYDMYDDDLYSDDDDFMWGHHPFWL